MTRALDGVLAGGGEMGQRIRAFDWAATPLGPIETWPQSLLTSLSLILNAQMPMWLGWGRELYFFYNDAYVQVLSHAKHPSALGRPAEEVWREIWDVCGPLANQVLDRAEAPFVEDVRLFMNRGGGFMEEVYYSFSYSPIRDESGRVGGLFCPNTEVTAKLLHARRLRTLSELSVKALVEKTIEAACASAAETLAKNPDDVPFALFYRGDGLQLHEVVGLDLARERTVERPWPIAEVFASGKVMRTELAPDPTLPRGLADQPIREVITLPITSGNQRLGVLVAGVNAARRLDTEYTTFFELVAGQVAIAIQNALVAEETKRRADMLTEIDRAKTVFFSNVSHEFRTPLTLMIGPTEDALGSPERALSGDSLETVYRNQLRLLKLVNALLDFSRLEAGRMQATYEPIELGTFTADLASGFRAAIERAGLQFVVDVAALPEPNAVDRNMWETIVLNLLSNALKFTLEGSIRVGLRAVGDTIELTVADTGTGVPAEELPRLFERFHRIENPKARTHEGTGIGLALVHELVRLHGGTIAVDSVVGRGTTFTVVIPRRAAHGAVTTRAVPAQRAYVEEAQRWAPDAPVSTPVAGNAPHVLLADDNADMRDYVRRLLEPELRVTAVPDGNAALAAIQTAVPDLILSDVMMPGLDGFGLLAAVRANPATAQIPVILVSARAGDEARVEGLGAGADDYLVKPFSARELVARVRTHLALAQARKRSDAAREELYSLLMQVPAAISVRRGPDLRCVFQNAASLAILDQRGSTMREIWEDNPRIGHFATALETGLPVTERELSATRSWAPGEPPTTKYWDITWAPLRLADGTIDGVMTVSFDATERVAARERARAAEERRRLAFDAADVGTWRVELATKIDTRDGALNRILGLPDAETAQPVDDFISRIHPDDRERIDAAIAHSIATREPYKPELRILRPDGSVRWLRVIGRVIEDASGQPIALTGAAADITDRRLAEERSEVALRRLEAALAASAIGTYFWDIRTNRVEHDAGVQRLFGFAQGQGGPIEDYTERIHADDRPAWLAGLERSEREGVDFQLEYRVVTDAGVRWLLDKAQMVRDASGPGYMVGAVVDITELKRLTEAALAASRAKDEFLAMLGHELRNPLAPIVTALELMKLRGDLADTARKTIERQVRHLTRLVDDLLDISRVTRGLIELERERLSVRDVIAKAVEIASPLIEQKAHHLVVDVPPNLCVDGDPIRLAQVFANLLTNAARYTDRGGHIRVTGERAGDRIIVRVSDDGSGIPPDLLERIFDLFVQGGYRGAARSEGGLGIGLALVRNLVALHGGTVVASSDGAGRGSTFTVDLAAVDGPAAGTGPRAAVVPPLQGRRVLVVDDNEDAAEMLGAALRHFGHEVLIVHDGAQALAALEQFAPQAAVLDIGLPVMDGYELARRLRATIAPCLLIALTGYGQESDRVRSVEAGFDAHMVKPVDLQALATVLEVS